MQFCHLLLLKRGQLFQIKKVHSNIKPELFELTDLMNSDLPGFYYAAQLTLAEKPDYKKDYFLVENILKEKTVKGKLKKTSMSDIF